MMKKLLMFIMLLAFAIPSWAGEKTVTISRNEGIYDDGTGVYYCTKDGITMTFSSGLNNVNYLVEHQQVVFYIKSDNYVIKKIKFNCLDNTTNTNLDCFYWGPSTIHELEQMATYTPTGTYNSSGYIGTWYAGPTDSKDVKFRTEGKPVRFGSVEITYDKEFGDIYDLVTSTSEIAAGQTYALVSKQSSRALGKVENHPGDDYETFSSTPVTLLNYDQTQNNYLKVKVTDEVQLIKLERAVSTTTTRPWHLKVGDNYIRRRNGSYTSGSGTNKGYNLFAVPTLPTDEFSLYSFRVSISFGTNSNALLKFYHPSGDDMNSNDMAIRHYNGGNLFRVMDSGSSNSDATYQRVYLYKPAQTYYVTTSCLPNNNSGYITLGEGVLNDGNGNYTSQQYDNVSFFVGPTEGWGVGAVTVTNLSTNEETTLTPTATSDFGNDYSFEMPANDVKVTANFLQPFNIDTICNPANGGQFNFINGYTNFSGQYYSNEGKTVTFKPTAADGYIFNSVTITDNGVTTTMTPDANGVYSFVMPSNGVTLTANFEVAHDLYLLGTANGETAWHPYGPKFIYDSQNEVYYIDVYFKGDSLYNNGAGDPYGHFSLSRMISTNLDENTGWGEISGSRIYATSLDYWVEDGNTYNNCFQTSTDYAFKIPAGVYRITVGKDLDYMSIAKYEPTLVFTPAGGDVNNPTVVALNTEVVITSNLEQLVHDINPNEPSHATFYNTTDNWATNQHANTRVISDYDVTTITANVNLGYIKKEDNASYEVVSDLYLLGTANGQDAWQPYGPQFTYDATTETYSLDVYFTGTNVTAADEGYGYFSLSKVISDPNDPHWTDIPNSARYNAEYNDVPITGLAYNQSTTEALYQTDPNWCFKIDPGVYTITVNKDKTQMTVTKHELTLTFNPVSGTTVAAGDNVTIGSNLDALVHAINANEANATFMYATSTDGSLPTPDTQGSTVTITAEGATTTVNAQASLGYIVVPGNANYTVPAPTVYSITTQVNPAGSNAGTITAPSGSEAGETVNFTVADADPSVYTLTGVEVVDSNNGIVQSFEPSADGNYSFTMPSDDVTIHADYERTKYNVTTSWSPSEGGAIWLNGVNTPQTVSVANGNQVVFGVAPAQDYSLVSLTVTNVATGEEIQPTASGSNEYTFTMPTGNVTINARYERTPYTVTTSWSPSEGGSISLNEVNVPQTVLVANGSEVSFIVFTNYHYKRVSVTVTNIETGEEINYVNLTAGNEFGFTMPAANVAIHVDFALDNYAINAVSVPEGGGTINVPTSEFYAEIVNFTVTPSPGYELNHVTLTYTSDGHTITINPHSGQYSFSMPNCDVTITAYFDKLYAITTVCDPDGAGEFEFFDDLIDDTYAHDGDWIEFGVYADDGYVLESVTVTNHETGEVTELEQEWDGDEQCFGFDMPDADVTITAHFAEGYKVTCVVIPSDGGNISGVHQKLDNDYQIKGEYYIPGETVESTIAVYAGYVLQSITLTCDDDPEQTVTLIDDGESLSETSQSKYYRSFVMPEADVTLTVVLKPWTPLKLIENDDYDCYDGDNVVVSDTLVVVWAAKDQIWAKDLVSSNYSVNVPDENALNVVDYVKDNLHLQKHDWDQSNWVILDCSDLYPEITDVTQRRKKLDDFVDHKVKGGTVKGVYHCTASYDHFSRKTKNNHVIKLSEEPEIISNFKGATENSYGYPGYIQDPREVNTGYDYHYNHYCPTNFFCDYFTDNSWYFEPGPKSSSDDQIFFLPPQDQEVAQVWAVYAGADTIKENGTTTLKDKFTVYEYYVQGNVTQNIFDLPGGFSVPADQWEFNRLNSGYTDESYGRPGKNDNEQTGSTKLIPDSAYLFHIAIKRLPGTHEYPEKKAPNKPAEFQEMNLFMVYPLDMESHSGNVTANRVVWAIDPAAREVESIRYYNVMGQESRTPFDGINIVVTRYTDGSASSKKIFR
jgi:hypothetical protein